MNLVYINLVMLINKYLNIYANVVTLLANHQTSYNITNIVNNFDIVPIYLDKPIDSNIVCFEFLFGSNIRKKQFEFAEKLYGEITLEDIDGPNLHQMLMGEGKSSVIAPVLTIMLINNYAKDKHNII
ncbi:MAG: hypothetical protein ACK5XN_00475, partial [Bacteroidota bacterium]